MVRDSKSTTRLIFQREQIGSRPEFAFKQATYLRDGEAAGWRNTSVQTSLLGIGTACVAAETPQPRIANLCNRVAARWYLIICIWGKHSQYLLRYRKPRHDHHMAAPSQALTGRALYPVPTALVRAYTHVSECFVVPFNSIKVQSKPTGRENLVELPRCAGGAAGLRGLVSTSYIIAVGQGFCGAAKTAAKRIRTAGHTLRPRALA